MLTRRQLEVIQLYAVGMDYSQIGDALFISRLTVMNHLRNIRSLVGAENSTHAVVICLARGYLCVDYRTERLYIPRPLDDYALDEVVALTNN